MMVIMLLIMMIARGVHTVAPAIKIVGGSFLQNAPGGLDSESDPCALTPPNCNLLHVVCNMFLYSRCCPQPIKAPLSQSTWPIHSPSQSMWHQKSFISSNTQGESGSCYIPDNQRFGNIRLKSINLLLTTMYSLQVD